MQIITNRSQKELKEHGSYQFPILVSRERLSGYDTGAFFWHWHPEVELTLVTEGMIEYHVNGSVFILKKGQALFGNANSLHSGNMVDGQADGYELEITGKLLRFWQLLVLNVDRQKGISTREQKDYDRIRGILSFIEKNYDKKLTIEQIAESVYMCTSQCSRLFKKYMKKTLFDFILEYRIERSLADLLDPDCSMAEAAAGVGFNDSNYYSKVFVRIKGCAPSVYRKKMRGR